MNPFKPAKDVLDAVVFPIKALAILGICTVVNALTTPHHGWVMWVALGLGIAFVTKAARAIRVLVITGVLAALALAAWRWWCRRTARTA